MIDVVSSHWYQGSKDYLLQKFWRYITDHRNFLKEQETEVFDNLLHIQSDSWSTDLSHLG